MLDIVVLALSVSVNIFQEFFCQSQLAPSLTRSTDRILMINFSCGMGGPLPAQYSRGRFIPPLSINCDPGNSAPAVRCTCLRLFSTANRTSLNPFYRIVLELTSQNSFTARPAFEIPLLGILTLLWLGALYHSPLPIHGSNSYRIRDTPTRSVQLFLDIEMGRSPKLFGLS